MRRRILTIAAVVVGSALILSACAPTASKSTAPKSGEDVTLKV